MFQCHGITNKASGSTYFVKIDQHFLEDVSGFNQDLVLDNGFPSKVYYIATRFMTCTSVMSMYTNQIISIGSTKQLHVCCVWYWPHATSHLQVSTCEYKHKMGEASLDAASTCAHQSLCATEFCMCTCT